VRYIPQLWKNLISVGALEEHGLRGALGESVLKMSSGSLVVLKGIRCNNLYYLKGNAITENLIASEHLEDDSTRLWQKRFRQVDLNSLKVLAKQGLSEGALTCNLESGEHCVLDKKTKVKFGDSSECLLDCVHVDIWDPIKTALLGGYW